MRRLFVTLFVILLVTPALFARANHDWEQAEKLKPGASVLVSLWSGDTFSGLVASVNATGLRLKTNDPAGSGIYQLQEFGRVDIRRIVRIRRPNLPNPQRWMLTGALIGGGVGFTSGAIYDATHHENYHWITGGFGGAVLGFFGSCTVLAGAGVVEIFRHHSSLVYEDQDTGKMISR